jgi:chlorobactene glucosyltransferase
MVWITALAGLSTLLLSGMLIIAVHNYKRFPRLTKASGTKPMDLPPVSILVPARNEAAHIASLVTALRSQAYPEFELIILDDHSCDGTAALAAAAAAGDPRVEILYGAALPSGWVGKNWACHQLSEAARYDWLLFTDADVIWEPDALAAVVAHARCHNADLLTVWPTQVTGSWAERMVVPMMAFFLLAFLPIALAHEPRAAAASAANGQCLLFSRRGYEFSGGHRAVRGSLVDDISLAYQTKLAGRRLRMADGNHLLHCRMYADFESVLHGYTKVLLAGSTSSLPLLFLGALALLVLFVAPWPLALAMFFLNHPGLAAWLLIIALLGIAVRGVTAATAHLPRRDALFLPVSVVVVTYITFHAIWTQLRHGGPVWKDRRFTPA